MSHIVSTPRQFNILKQGLATEQHQQQIADYIKKETAHTVFINDSLIDPTNSTKQLGRYYQSNDFEDRLATILPSNCVFINNPFRTGFKAVVRMDPTQFMGYHTISAYERGILPEHSVMELKDIEVPDLDIMSRKKSLHRSDLSKHEYVPGQGYVFDDKEIRAGFKKAKQVGHEIKRGWRTILLYCLKEGVVTLTDVERVFGSKDHPSWSQHTGKREITLPW